MANIKFAQWLRAAKKEEIEQLCTALGGRVRSFLYQLTYPKEKGGRELSAKTAAKFEQAIAPIARRSQGRLAPLDRGELCDTCSKCKFYRSTLHRRDTEKSFDDLE